MPPGMGEALELWAMGLTRTQSGEKLSLYVKCRGGEEVCEKRVLSLGRNQVPYIGIFPQPLPRSLITSCDIISMTHSDS